MKARAAVFAGPERPLEVCEVDVEAPRAGEALVRMAAGGVCHTDLHVMHGTFAAPAPAILGHEGAGVVEAVGPGVTSVRPGDHVVPLWRIACGECEYCTDARPALCPSGLEVRRTGRLPDGTTRFSIGGRELKHFAGVSSFAEYSVIPEKGLLPIPKDIPLDRAALLGCAVITGYGAVVHAVRVKPGSRVAVIGSGGVGLNVVQAAALAGTETIVAVDLLESKLAFARRFGATHTVLASAGEPVAAIRELTGGRGVDYAFDVVGLPLTVRQAYDTLAKSWPLEQINEAYAALERGEAARSVVVF